MQCHLSRMVCMLKLVTCILVAADLAPNNGSIWQMLHAGKKGTPSIIQHWWGSPKPLSVPEDFDIFYVLKSFPKGTAAGPSGLWVQYLLDAAAITLPTSICSLLRGVVNLLASGKVPREVSIFLAGGTLALNKLKDGCSPDVRPITVRKVLRCLTGKCLHVLVKLKASDFFKPLKFGVACPLGSEKSFMALGLVYRITGEMRTLLFSNWFF